MNSHDLERRLRSDAEHWRKHNHPEASDAPLLAAPSRGWWPAAAAAAAVLVVVGGAVLAQGDGTTKATSHQVAGASPAAGLSVSSSPSTAPSATATITYGPAPSEGLALKPSGPETAGASLATSRFRSLQNLLPEPLKSMSDPRHPSTSTQRSDGSMYTTLGSTDGAVSIVATWDRLTVPVSSTAVPGFTSLTTRADGDTVIVRDQATSPEVMMIDRNGDSIDVAVTGDSSNEFPVSQLTSMAQQLVALR